MVIQEWLGVFLVLVSNALWFSGKLERTPYKENQVFFFFLKFGSQDNNSFESHLCPSDINSSPGKTVKYFFFM
jgi:hypothetical protein